VVQNGYRVEEGSLKRGEAIHWRENQGNCRAMGCISIATYGKKGGPHNGDACMFLSGNREQKGVEALNWWILTRLRILNSKKRGDRDQKLRGGTGGRG